MSIASVSKASALPPRRVITWDKAERMWRNYQFWQDKDSIVHRLPDHFKQRYWKSLLVDRTPVHSNPPQHRFVFPTDHEKKKWAFRFDLQIYTGIQFEKEDYPVNTLHCPEQDEGLWGGESIVKGFRVSRPYTRKKVLPRHMVTHIWFPEVNWSTLYSEILDKYMKILVTERALRLIDDNFGLDYYLLRTSDLDLNSRLGRKLKRELLVALASRSYYPDNPEKHKEIAEKYKEFVMPLEEAEWVGLDLNEACRKQQDIEEKQLREKRPEREKFEKDYVELLRKGGV